MPHSRRALLISAATVSAPVAMLSGWASPDSEVLSVAAELEAGDEEFQRLCCAAETATEQDAPRPSGPHPGERGPARETSH